MPEETLATETAWQGRFLQVRRDRVMTDGGREATREVVVHPGAVAVVATTADGDLLLVRQWRQAVGREMLEIPAGTCEPGEPPAETARRELLEETGHEAGELRALFTFAPTPGYSAEEITLFHATGCRPSAATRPEDEPAHLVTVPGADVAALVSAAPEMLLDGKTLVALLWLLQQG